MAAMSSVTDQLPMVGSFVQASGRKLYNYMLEPQFFDPKTRGWSLLSNEAAFLVVALYLLAVPLTKQMMASRKPINVKDLMFFHNIAMAALSLWMLVESVRWGKEFTPACAKLAGVLHVHFISKALEFIDTFFMVLRKNDHQISFLHVYHHATTFWCWWITMNIAPGGDTYFVCAINSFVHVFMYTYYLVSSNKSVRIPVIIKKSITLIQLLQFGIVFCQVLYGHFVADYTPRLILYLAIFQTAFFIYLFGGFFRKAYAKAKQSAARGVKDAQANGLAIEKHSVSPTHPIAALKA